MTDLMERPTLIYVADPMCSWCWGFAPVITRIVERVGDAADLRMVMGGLRAGNAEPMDDGMTEYISSAWQRVGERTGATFDVSFFERSGFVYDTEPACRAVVTVRAMQPAAALPYMKRVQEAFYANNRDVTDGKVLADIAVEAGLDRQAFVDAFDSEDMKRATLQDFQIANQSGINGFPAVLVGSAEKGFGALTLGYQDFDALSGTLDAWLDDVAAAA